MLGSHLTARSPLAEKARALIPMIDEHADFADDKGRLADPVVAALHRDGLFTMWLPKVLGGVELGPVQSLEVLENLSYADASAGWVVMAASLSVGTAGAYLSDEAVDTLFGQGGRPVIAGQGTRPGVAIPDGKGFRLSGSWSFASGLLHGTHIHTLAIIEGTGEPRIFVLPVEKAKLLGNWDVIGLRGTGSIDYTIDNAYVPDGWSHFAVTETPKRGGSIYQVGIIGFAEQCHTGWAMGVGRRMLDELALLAQGKAGRAGSQSDSSIFLEGFAKFEGRFRGARALAIEAWGDVAETFARGGRLSVRQQTLVRLALVNITDTLHELGNYVYLAAGTTSLRRGTLQRLIRDVHAGTQHITSGPGVRQSCGRELAGLAAGKVWQFLDLVPG
ncbi:MAG: acyl-CoA dehydrogenase family protein [Burkholderiales bacterium]